MRFWKQKVTEHKMCVLIFSTTFVRNISHFKKNSARYDQKIYIGLQVKCRLLLSDCNETWILMPVFRRILKYQISWNSVQWKPSCSMRTDGRTDMTKLTVAIRKLAHAPKSSCKSHRHSISVTDADVKPMSMAQSICWCTRRNGVARKKTAILGSLPLLTDPQQNTPK